MPNKNNPELPEKTYAITAEDKAKIRDFGQALTGFILEHFKGESSIPLKYIIGGFQYVGSLHDQRANLITKPFVDDFKVSFDEVSKLGLVDQLDEPFSVEPESAVKVEPVAVDEDVEAASIIPSSNLAPISNVTESGEETVI